MPTDRSTPHRSGRDAAALLAGLLCLAVSACSGPQVATGPGADPSRARGLLVAAASEGPVPIEIDRTPAVFAGGPAEVAGIVRASLSSLATQFEPVALGMADRTRRRLVLRFEDVPPDPAGACNGSTARSALPPPPVRLHAVFCDGLLPVADVAGTAASAAPADAEGLVRAVVGRLFPGTQGGYSYYPGVGIGVGVGVGSGGSWGLGGGLRF
jgi:hypothetical protein